MAETFGPYEAEAAHINAVRALRALHISDPVPVLMSVGVVVRIDSTRGEVTLRLPLMTPMRHQAG